MGTAIWLKRLVGAVHKQAPQLANTATLYNSLLRPDDLRDHSKLCCDNCLPEVQRTVRIALSLIFEILKTTFPVPRHWPMAQASISTSKFWVLQSLTAFSHQIFLHFSQTPVKTHREEPWSMYDHLQYYIWILTIRRKNLFPQKVLQDNKHPEND